MKRYGFLYEKIACTDNLLLAWTKVRKGKQNAVQYQQYEQKLDANIAKLREQLLHENYTVGNYTFFTIHDPKKRSICAALLPERILHHAIMNVCAPYFEHRQLFDSYATRKEKGTFAAIERAEFFLKKGYWVAKFDVRKYFYSISHALVKQMLRKIFKDQKLLQLFDAIIDSYEHSEGYGLPIGNLTSQFLANHYLSSADYYAQAELKVAGYVRYMDDILLFHPQRQFLTETARKFNTFVSTNLDLQLKPVQYAGRSVALPFLGFRLLPWRRSLSARSKRRFLSTYKLYQRRLDSGKWTEHEFRKHTTPLFAFAQQADTLQLRRKIVALANRQTP